jgi:putative ABC transport system substrate-binding protein
MTRGAVLFLLMVSLSLLAPVASGEPTKSVPVLGILMAAAAPNDALVQSLREGLRELGYVEGQNIRFEYRGAQGHAERLPQLAQELVKLKVDVILCGAGASIRAARQATSTIPILAVIYDEDPVTSGLIESLNRPGGNLTGIYQRHLELAGKRLELLKQALPHVSRVAVFWDSFGPRELAEFKAAAPSLGITLEPIELGPPYDFQAAYRLAKKRKAGAVILSFSSVFYAERTRVGALGLENGLPVMSHVRDTTLAGGFMSYGHEWTDSWHRFAYFVDRLLKGAKAGELPVEQVDTLKLVVNVRTATKLGLTVPQSMLLRADEVIQ